MYCIEVLVHIYIGVPLRNPREGGCVGAGGLTAWGAQLDHLGQHRQGNCKSLDAPPR
jgi:hypothetical protein